MNGLRFIVLSCFDNKHIRSQLFYKKSKDKDYCKYTSAKIQKESQLLRAIKEKRLPIGIGTSGNCGIFVKALDNYFCGKGQVVGFFNGLSENYAYHMAYLLDTCIIDDQNVVTWKNRQEMYDIYDLWTDIHAFDIDDDQIDPDIFEEEMGISLKDATIDTIKKYVAPEMFVLDPNDVHKLTEINGDYSELEIIEILNEYDNFYY